MNKNKQRPSFVCIDMAICSKQVSITSTDITRNNSVLHTLLLSCTRWLSSSPGDVSCPTTRKLTVRTWRTDTRTATRSRLPASQVPAVRTVKNPYLAAGRRESWTTAEFTMWTTKLGRLVFCYRIYPRRVLMLTFYTGLSLSPTVTYLSRTTQWEDPRVQIKKASNLPLPPGWEERYTGDGTKYFVDHNTRSTTFQDPRVAISATSSGIHYERSYRWKVRGNTQLTTCTELFVDYVKISCLFSKFV